MSALRRSSRLVADTLVGYVLLAAGLIMLVTPGPGLVAIAAGLAVLARHFRWAERLKRAAVTRIHEASSRLRARRAVHRAAGSRAAADGQPPEIAPTSRRGSRPVTTGSGSGVSVGASERSSPAA
jgi:hypothetical protein